MNIKQLYDSSSLRWTDHVILRLIQRGVKRDDVKCALTKPNGTAAIKPERSQTYELLLLQRRIGTNASRIHS